jgi:hypothetical protein
MTPLSHCGGRLAEQCRTMQPEHTVTSSRRDITNGTRSYEYNDVSILVGLRTCHRSEQELSLVLDASSCEQARGDRFCMR